MSQSSKSYSEKDIATNLLVTLKHMKAEYNTFTQEASNESLYSEIKELYDCISTQQRNVFEMMCSQSWYQMTADSAKNISKAYTKFSKSESELS
ncbi:spore coat protein [[Eubacterium] hominis]|uniref:spore coat protein n=1 Tax=[Eubacterium] hominis TaxID=2764325 RepID=UPI003A4D5174